MLHLPQPVAAPVDVDYVAVVKQPVEYRRGEDFVPCQHFRPFPDALVRRDDGAVPFVPGADEVKQEVSVPPVEVLKSEFVDYKHA